MHVFRVCLSYSVAKKMRNTVRNMAPRIPRRKKNVAPCLEASRRNLFCFGLGLGLLGWEARAHFCQIPNLQRNHRITKSAPLPITRGKPRLMSTARSNRHGSVVACPRGPRPSLRTTLFASPASSSAAKETWVGQQAKLFPKRQAIRDLIGSPWLLHRQGCLAPVSSLPLPRRRSCCTIADERPFYHHHDCAVG